MDIDIHKKYFLMSTRCNKSNSTDFGLTPYNADKKLCVDKNDNSMWVQKELFDLGWGKEFGYVKLPELNFEELWFLIINSNIHENIYGAANELLEIHSDNLLIKIEGILSEYEIDTIDNNIKNALEILVSNSPINNRCSAENSSKQFNQDLKRWKTISEKMILFKLEKIILDTELKRRIDVALKPFTPRWKFW